jgi:hypothetical protein
MKEKENEWYLYGFDTVKIKIKLIKKQYERRLSGDLTKLWI